MNANNEVYAKLSNDKYEEIMSKFESMDKTSADYIHAAELIGSLEKGFIPLEMREYSTKTEFMKENPEFKFGYTIIDDKPIHDTVAISGVDNTSESALFGKNFGSYMGINTQKAHYILDKDENGSLIKDDKGHYVPKDFKDELKEYFTENDYNSIDKIFINNDTSRIYTNSVQFDNNVTVKDYSSLQITTFEIHKLDGEIDYKTYFTNSAGDILTDVSNGDDFPMLMGEDNKSKCDILDTAKDNTIYKNPRTGKEEQVTKIPYDSLLSLSETSMDKACNIQADKIVAENNITKDMVEPISNSMEIAKSIINCLYVEKNMSMAGITGTYDKIDGLAKEIAGNQNYMSRLDKSSEEYEALKAKNNDLKEEFKETVVEFGKIYNNTELFNENKINEVKEYYFEKEKNLDVINSRDNITKLDIIKGISEDGNSLDVSTRFRGIVNLERPVISNAKTISESTFDDADRGREKIINAIENWNRNNPESPISYDDKTYIIYDKHGMELNIYEGGFEKSFNSDFALENATTPKDDRGIVTKEAVAEFKAEDSDKYKEFISEFDTGNTSLEDIDVKYDFDNPTAIIERYLEDGVSLDDNDEISSEIRKEIGIDSEDKSNIIDTSSIGEGLSSDGKDKVYMKSSVSHIDYNGEIRLSDKKMESIKEECRDELKGMTTDSDAYKKAYEDLLNQKVTQAEANLSRIVDNITDSDMDIAKMEKYLGSYFSRLNITLGAERIGLDSKISDYEKAGGYIGEGGFIKDTPSFLEKFGHIRMFMNGNLLETIVSNAVYAISDSIENRREDKIENEKNNVTKVENTDNDKFIEFKESNDIEIEKDDTVKDEVTLNDENIINETADIEERLDEITNDDEDEIRDLENDKDFDEADINVNDIDNSDDYVTHDEEKGEVEVKNEDNEENRVDSSDEDNDEKSIGADDSDLNMDTPDDFYDENNIYDMQDEENYVEQIPYDEDNAYIDEDTAFTSENDDLYENNDMVLHHEDNDAEEYRNNDDMSNEDDDSVYLESEDDIEEIEIEEDKENDDISNEYEDNSEILTDNDESITEKNENDDDIAIVDASDDDISEEEEDDDEGDENVISDENDKDDSIIDKIKDEIEDIISDYLEGYSELREEFSDIFDFLDMFSSPEEFIETVIEVVSDTISDFINDKEITNVDGDYISVNEKLSEAAEAIVDVADICSSFMEIPADEIRDGIINEFEGNIPDGMISNIDYQVDELKASEQPEYFESAEYNGIDFSEYADITSEPDFESIEMEIKENPIGVDNDVLKEEVQTANDIESLSNDYIDDGYSCVDAYSMAEQSLAPEDFADINQNYDDINDYNNDFENNINNNYDFENNGFNDEFNDRIEDNSPADFIDNGMDGEDVINNSTEDIFSGEDFEELEEALL